MTRPSAHDHGGDGESAPIAGDPSTFPTDAELARTLVHSGGRATISTLTADGYPYGSMVSYVVDDDGNPIILISEMAEHTVNSRGDKRASMLVASDPVEGADPLSSARLTLIGDMEVLDDPGELRDRYLEVHDYAGYYVDFGDFNFWRLRITKARFVGGFGHMSWMGAADYNDATADPVAPAAAGIVEHMNDDHADANLMYAQHLAGLTDATDATMTSVDRHGFTLQVATPAGPRMARLGFNEDAHSGDEVRQAVIVLLKDAREKAGQA